jgi:K+-sensing histidine kinase KdpD
MDLCIHQVKTPLTAVKLQMDLTSKNLKKTPMTQNQIESIIDKTSIQVNRLMLVIDQLIDVTQLQDSEFSLNPHYSNADDFFSELNQYFSKERFPGLEFNYECTTNVLLYWDCEKLLRTFKTLILFRVQFLKSGLIHLKISPGGDRIFVEIIDHSHVMTDVQIARIQELLLLNKKSIKDPRFLSLMICNKMIQLHHGQMIIKSHENYGTIFEISLPCKLVRS